MIGDEKQTPTATGLTAPSASPTFPSSFPAGVNPQKYKGNIVSFLLERAAYFNMYSADDPLEHDVPILARDGSKSTTGIHVERVLRRFDVSVSLPTREEGVRASNLVGEPLATLSLRLLLIPEGFAATPDREPPATALDFNQSQRFALYDADLSFGGEHHFRGFGAGRTYPAIKGDQRVLDFGAVLTLVEGFGRFRGRMLSYLLLGHITSSQGLFFNCVCRMVDLDNEFSSVSALPDISPVAHPDPEIVFLTFLGERDPEHPPAVVTGSDGKMQGAKIHEFWRPIHLDVATGNDGRIRTKMTVGPVVATYSSNLLFRPFDQPSGTIKSPMSWGTRGTLITFFDQKGNTIGTLQTQVAEGRAFTMELPGAPAPVYRLSGFGPLIGGTGYLAGVQGMSGVNAEISVLPGALSNLYVLRIIDPDGKYRRAIADRTT